MGNTNLKTNNNVNRIIMFVRIIGFVFMLVMILVIQSNINSMLQEGNNYSQLFMTISAILIITGMLINYLLKKTGAVITIIGSIGLGITVCIGSNSVSHLLPLAMAVGLVFAIIPFIIGLVFLVIDRYNLQTESH